MLQLTRAPSGGHTGLDGKFRRGGEFEPFYVPRQDMPQVDEVDYVPLLADFAWHLIGENVTSILAPNTVEIDIKPDGTGWVKNLTSRPVVVEYTQAEERNEA